MLCHNQLVPIKRLTQNIRFFVFNILEVSRNSVKVLVYTIVRKSESHMT